MMSILDQVARSSARAQRKTFRPTTASEFFSLRLAAKLNDSPAAQHYARLAQDHSQGQLLTAYNRAAHVGDAALARQFHVELERLHHRNGCDVGKTRIAAIRIDRRAVAIAVLTGDHLEYTQPKQLSSFPEKAVGSATNFVGSMAEKFTLTSVALESAPHGEEVQRAVLHHAIVGVLKRQAISIWKVSKADLFQAFAFPPLDSRKQLREVASDIYPVLDQEPGRPWTLDAAALGLYVQTERLFNNF